MPGIEAINSCSYIVYVISADLFCVHDHKSVHINTVQVTLNRVTTYIEIHCGHT